MRLRASPALAPLLLLLAAASAPAGDILALDSVQASGPGVAAPGSPISVKLSGSLPAPSAPDRNAPVTVQFGEFLATLPPRSLVRKGATLRWTAPRGSTGIRSVAVSPATGRFTVLLREVLPGDLAAPVAVTVRFGATGITARLPLVPRGSRASWSSGDPMEATLSGRVLAVEHREGRSVLRPLGGASFVRGPEDGSLGVAGRPRTDVDGNFTLDLGFTDAAVLRGLDLGAVLGSRPGLSGLPRVELVPGIDGQFRVAAVVQRTSGVTAPLDPGADADLVVAAGAGLRGGTLHVPAGAVAAPVAELEFTPLALPAALPLPIPEGFVALAAAEVGTEQGAVAFAAGAGPTMVLERPEWTAAGPLAESWIVLLQVIDGRWEVQPGRGRYDPATDRIGPDPEDPAGLGRASPAAWATSVSLSLSTRVGGVVLDAEKAPVPGAVVLTAAGATVADGEGRFDLPAATLEPQDLEVVQVVEGPRSSAEVMERGDAGAVDLVIPLDLEGDFRWTVGLVSGSVVEPYEGSSYGLDGAKVTLRLSPAVRGLAWDDRGTADNFADDLLEVGDLSSLGVASYEWRLRLPGDTAEFVSAKSTGRSASPVQLLIEAQNAGRVAIAGAYAVRVVFTIPGVGRYGLQAGFRTDYDDFQIRIADIRLPPAYEGTASVEAITDAGGGYSIFYRAPTGFPLEAWAEKGGFDSSRVTVFPHADYAPLDIRMPAWRTLERPPFSPGSSAAAIGGDLWWFGYPLSEEQWITDLVKILDPETGTWSDGPPMPTPRTGATVEEIGGKVFVIGGSGAFGNTGPVEILDPSTGLWSRGAACPTVINPGRSAVWHGRIFLFGGWPANVRSYDPATDRWSFVANLPIPAWNWIYLQAVEWGDRILLIGNALRAPDYTATTGLIVLSFDPATNTFAPGATWGEDSTITGAGVIDGRVYVIATNRLLVYDPRSDAWERSLDLRYSHYQTPTIFVDNRIYLFDWYQAEVFER